MQTSLSQFFSTPRASTLSANTMAQIEQRLSKTTPRRKKKAPKLKSIENRGSTSSSPAAPRKYEQLIMDLGQKNIGVQHCIKCGMVYSQENPSDVKQHDKYHNRFDEVRNFRVTASQIEGWKKNLQYEEVSAPVAGYLFQLKPDSTATLRRKLEEILTNFVNEELGIQNDQKAFDGDKKRHAFVFIANAPNSSDQGSSNSSSTSNTASPPFIAGILLIENVQEVIVMPEEKHYKGQFLGVDRIWVHSHERRKGIATFLLDSARRLLANSTKQFSRLRVAFSDPGNLGVKLATGYANQHQNKDKENKKDGGAAGTGRYIIYSSPTIPGTTINRADALIKKLSNTSNGSA